MLKKIFFHIGTPKTGTSIIQSHMAQNRKTLRDKGVLYPITISSDENLYRTFDSHHLLTYSWADMAPFNKFNIGDFWARVEKTSQEENLDTMLLSAENTFWLPKQLSMNEQTDEKVYWANKRTYIKKIYEDLKYFDTTIVVYLRRQDYWLESWYNQQIKNGNYISNDMSDFANNMHPLMDYMGHLAIWAEFFGEDKIIVRAYEKEQLPNGLLADFINTLNLGYADEYKLSAKGRHNAQLTRDTVEFLNICNSLDLTDDQRFWLRMNIRKITNQFDTVKVYSKQNFLKADERLELLEKYEPINASIQKVFRAEHESPLFKEKWPSINDDPEYHSGLSAAVTIKLLVMLMMEIKSQDILDNCKKPDKISHSESVSEEERTQLDLELWEKHKWDFEMLK